MLYSKYMFTNIGYSGHKLPGSIKKIERQLSLRHQGYSGCWAVFMETFVDSIPVIILMGSAGIQEQLEVYYGMKLPNIYFIPCPYAIIYLDVL